jgi:hypothetical protein
MSPQFLSLDCSHMQAAVTFMQYPYINICSAQLGFDPTDGSISVLDLKMVKHYLWLNKTGSVHIT